MLRPRTCRRWHITAETYVQCLRTLMYGAHISSHVKLAVVVGRFLTSQSDGVVANSQLAPELTAAVSQLTGNSASTMARAWPRRVTFGANTVLTPAALWLAMTPSASTPPAWITPQCSPSCKAAAVSSRQLMSQRSSVTELTDWHRLRSRALSAARPERPSSVTWTCGWLQSQAPTSDPTPARASAFQPGVYVTNRAHMHVANVHGLHRRVRQTWASWITISVQVSSCIA